MGKRWDKAHQQAFAREAVTKGNIHIAARAGVSVSTVQRWRKLYASGNPPVATASVSPVVTGFPANQNPYQLEGDAYETVYTGIGKGGA